MASRQIARVPAAGGKAGKPPKVRVSVGTGAQQVIARIPQYSVDMESFNNAYAALPYAGKFFSMIYRLNPVRTILIISVYMLQGLLPALRLRTGGDFINQVRFPLVEYELTLAVARGNSVGDNEFAQSDPSCHHPSIYIRPRTKRLDSFVA
jgi:hypothetical protein